VKKQTDHEFRGRFGKMVMGINPLLLDEDQLSETQNMQPGYGWRQRRGKSALTASAVATGLRFKSMVQFRDLRGFTDVILAHTYDSVNGDRIMEGSALPPNAITWTEKYVLTAGGEICDFGVASGAVFIANDKDFLIWRGNQSLPTGVFFYDGSSDKFLNYWEETTDFKADTELDLSVYVANDLDALYIISEMPLNKIVVDMNDINAVMSFLKLQYWSGAEFDEITSRSTGGTFVDGTKKSSDPTIDEFTGTTINASMWNGPFGTMAAYMTQDDALIVETAFNGDAYIDTNGNEEYSGDFSIVGKLDCGGVVNGAGSDSNSMRIYVLKVGETNTNCYFGRFARTGATETSHLSEIKTLGVRDDEQWTNVNPDQDQVTWYRIERVGSDLSCYWWSERTGVWTIEATTSGWTTDPVFVRIFSRMVNYTTWLGDPAFEYIRVGTPMNQDGEITWTPPADEVATSLQNIPGFVYKLQWPDDINGSIEQLGIGAPMAPVENIWFGQDVFPTGCYVWNGTDATDYTAFVNNSVETQFADLSAATNSYVFYIGFAQRMSQIILFPASVAQNTADAQIDEFKFFNASGLSEALPFVDQTLDMAGNSSFSQKGAVRWEPPPEEEEKATTLFGDTTPMFWYRLHWDATLSDPTNIYLIRGVPHPDTVDPSYGTFGHKRRAWQIAPVRNENSIRYSAADLPNVWNGLDSGYVFFGERPLRAAVAYYNEAIVFADTEMWQLLGTSPSTFGRLRLSSKVGIVAPRSLVTIESGVVVGDTIKNVLAWFFNDGIWMFDNARIWKISSPDIDNFFDPDHDDYINPEYADQTYGVYDFETQICMWIVYSGPTATTPTKVLAMHFPSMWFGIYDYATDLSSLLSVISDKYYTVAGGNSDGKFYLVNDGITDLDASGNTVAVDAFVTTRDMFLSVSEGIRQRLLSVWTESKAAGGLIELDEYPDGSKTPQNIGKKSMTWLGKIFGAFQKRMPLFAGQKTTKFRVRNRSKNSRMILLGYSTTVDRGRADE